MSTSPHSPISTITYSDTFATLYNRVNEVITVVNQIKMYDVSTEGGLLHIRQIGTPTEVLSLNLGKTGPGNDYGYGLKLIGLGEAQHSQTIGVNELSEYEGKDEALSIDIQGLESAETTVAASTDTTAYVGDSDYVLFSPNTSTDRGDGVGRPLKVAASDSIPYTINGNHRFTGDVVFDSERLAISTNSFFTDAEIIYIASDETYDYAAESIEGSDPTADRNSAALVGSGIVIKATDGDKHIKFVLGSTATSLSNNAYVFESSENFKTKGSYISDVGGFKFVAINNTAPYISLRTKNQDTGITGGIPTGWKIYQSVTGAAAGTLKFIREGLNDTDALQLFSNAEVKIGTIHIGSTGNGSFKTLASNYAVPAVANKGVLDYSWQNRDTIEISSSAAGGMFAESLLSYLNGTVLAFNSNGKYIKAQWNADPDTGYKDAEVVGILEKKISDYVLTIPGITRSSPDPSPVNGYSYTQNEPVSIKNSSTTINGYIYNRSTSSVDVYVDEFPTGITAGSLTGSAPFFTGGATLYGSFGDYAMGICGTNGITVSQKDFAVIVRQGLFDIPETGSSAATGYAAITGLTAGYVMYLYSNGGVTYATDNEFNSQDFYQANATVGKPLFVYLGLIDGKRVGMFNHYQGLGLTQAVLDSDSEPVYYSPDTDELTNFDLLGEVGGKNKIINSGFDIWNRLDTMGGTYFGTEGSTYSGITFNITQRSAYPYGATYSAVDSTGLIKSSYIADGYFIDTYTGRVLGAIKQPISSYTGLDQLSSPPENELVLRNPSASPTSTKTRLYAIVPNHRNLQESQLNLSFFGKASATTGITVGLAYVYSSGSTYAVIESYHTSLASGYGVSGGTFYGATLGTSYQRFNFPFSSIPLNLNQTANKNSFVAPFIEIGTIGAGSNATISTTGWQLSKGMSVKPYEKRTYGQEKGDCDRFFQNIVLAHGGYFPVSTGTSGPSLFTATNFPVPFANTPLVVGAVDVLLRGICGGSTYDATTVRKNSLSVFRSTNPSSTTYHRYFETVYAIDASGFSGTLNTRLLGMT